MAGRRIKVGPDDVMLVNGYEIAFDVLVAVTNPEARLLWAFMHGKEKKTIQPVAYDERRVIWIEDGDLEHIDIGVD